MCASSRSGPSPTFVPSPRRPRKSCCAPCRTTSAKLDIEALYLAAAAQARVGGDFYEALATVHGVRMIIGDVRGKGLPAVGMASAILGCFREAAYDEPDLARLARRLDVSTSRYTALLPGDRMESFATALLVEIPDDGSVVGIVNLGHPLRCCSAQE